MISPFVNSAVTVAGFKTGQVAGSSTAVQLPTHVCSFVVFKAAASNTSGVFLGPDNSVAVESGTANNFVAGFELESGESTGWLPCRNLNEFWMICDNAADDLLFMLIP